MAKIWQKKTTLYTLSIALIAAICFVGKLKNIPFEKLTGDPAMVNDTNPLVSFLSNLGALLCVQAVLYAFLRHIQFNLNIERKILISYYILEFSPLFYCLMTFSWFMII